MIEKYKLNGTVHAIGEEQKISEKFRKIEMVIRVAQDYDNLIPVEWINNQCDIIRTIQVGDIVTVHFTLAGRLWDDPKTGKTRCFPSNRGVDCELVQAGNLAKDEPAEEFDVTIDDKSEDLPF